MESHILRVLVNRFPSSRRKAIMTCRIDRALALKQPVSLLHDRRCHLGRWNRKNLFV